MHFTNTSPKYSAIEYFLSKEVHLLTVVTPQRRTSWLQQCDRQQYLRSFPFAKLKAVSSSGKLLLVTPLARSQEAEEGISLLPLFFLSHPVAFIELFAKKLQFQHSGDLLSKGCHSLGAVGV